MRTPQTSATLTYSPSKYRVAVPLNEGKTLLYSTLTTSLVVLDNSVFEQIFVKGDYSNQDTCAELYEMGLLCREGDVPQSEQLRQLRRQTLEAGRGITGITIAPTMDCNARCAYCFERGARRGTMTRETAEQLARFLIENCPDKKLYIAWFGGEPLLAPEIISLVTRRLRDAGIDIESTVTTNGILIDEAMVERFHEWGVYRVQVTIDGLGPTYNAIKHYVGVEGDPFERVMGAVELLLATGMSVHLRINYKSDDMKTLQETFMYLHGRFGDNDNVYIYGAPLELPECKSCSEFDEDEGRIFLDAIHLSLDRGYWNDELNFREGVNVSEDYNAALGELMLAPFPAPCFMINRWRFIVDDQGLLYKCQRHLGKADYACGNVFHGVDHNACYAYYTTDELHDARCEECALLPVCQGGCNSNRLLYGEKFACPPSKTIVGDLVLAYYRYLTGDIQG